MTMRASRFGFGVTEGLLLASGLVAVTVAATTFVAPDILFAAYGIDVRSDVNLTNELKAPEGVLLVTGLLALSGVFRTELTKPALVTAAAVYLAYGLSRLLSIAMDGIPSIALVVAGVVEMSLGLACLLHVALRRGVISG